MESNLKRHSRSLGQKNWLRIAICAGFLLVSFFFFSSAQRAKKNAGAVWRNVTLFLKTPLSAEDARMLCAKQDDLAYAVWSQRNDLTVTDPDLGRRVRTDVLTCCGSPKLVLPMAGGLSAGDTEGCLIGEQTAWDLFGSIGVVGDEICVGDEVKTIRAVIGLPKDCVVVVKNGAALCGDETDIADLRYDRITLATTRVTDGESFLMQHGLNAALLRLDYLCGFGWLSELVPGKWSDLSGWQDNITQKKQDFALLSSVQKNSPELYYERQCRRYRRDRWLGAGCVVMAVGMAFWCAGGIFDVP